MKTITKLSLALIATLTLTTSASAQQLGITAKSVNLEDESTIMYGVHWGYGGSLKDSLYTGLNLNLELGNMNDEQIYDFSADFKLGYSPTKNIALYGLGGYLSQTVNSIDGRGWGYGVGALYKFDYGIEINLDYKKYSLEVDATTNFSYDYDTISTSVSIVF